MPKSGWRYAAIFILLAGLILMPARIDSQSLGSQRIEIFRNNPSQSMSDRYLLFLPPDYQGKEQDWPLIVFLHGGSARGHDISRLRRYVLPGYLEKGIYPMDDFPFIVISPQYARGTTWRDNAEPLGMLIEEVCSELRVDTGRIYLTGPSLGGQGTWFIASRFPDRFAAIAPVAAVRTPPEWAFELDGMPVWAFHGKRDKAAPIRAFRQFMKKYKRPGTCRITIYDLGHVETIHSAYKNKELYAWFLKQKRQGEYQVHVSQERTAESLIR